MKEEKGTEEEQIIKSAVDCLKKHEERESENIKRAEEAIRFRALEQWPTQIKQDRENIHQQGGPRPCPVLDKTNQYVRQIINEERQNRAAIKYRPVDDDSDPIVAEKLMGLARHIEDASEAIEAYTTAGEHAIDGGFGYFRVIADYCDDMSFDQDIRIKRIHNRFSVALGPHTESDGSDAQEGLIWEDMDDKAFKKEYPNAKEVDFKQADGWAEEDTVRVAEYMCIKQTPVKIVLMDTGEVFNEDDYKQIKENAEVEGVVVPEPIDTRTSQKKTVHWYKVTSEEILEQRELVGTYIPIVKVAGNELTMPDGKIRTSGAIESMMDPQRLHNYSHAGFIENVALAPRAPWVGSEEAVEGYEDEYSNANRYPISLLKYKQFDDEGRPLEKPDRLPPPGISTGWQQMLQNTEHGIEASIGMYGPTVGAQSQEKSGIALQEQKNQGMVGNFHFPDNLSRSIQHCGRILLEWIPKYYDTERVARILDEEGEPEMIKLNPNQDAAVMPEVDEMGQEVGSIYNLNIGKYDVTVTTGPSYTAKRQEAADSQLQIINARPELLEVIGDILFSNLDSPGSDAIAERMKVLLPPNIQELEASKDKTPLDPKVQMAQQQIAQAREEIQNVTMAMEQKGQELQQYEQEIASKAQEASADKKDVDTALKQLASEKKVFQSTVNEQMAKFELSGVKLIDEIEEITDPIARELSENTEKEETVETEEGPETIVVQDPGMQEALERLADITAQAQLQMSQNLEASMSALSEIVTRPRIAELEFDEEGNPIRSISRV